VSAGSAGGAPLRVVLASQSPRRRELLAQIGIPHDVAPADIDEAPLPGEPPAAHCERLAREKALAVAGRDPDAVTIGSDTIVVIDGRILGKPADDDDARRTLRTLSGRTHTVYTAVAASRRGDLVSSVERVAVTFRELADEEIAAYVATREPMDKAGSYGIQGFGATIVAGIDGDYFAVMGLPVGRLVRLLARLGVEYRFGPLRSAAG
jgi:septum formation protein